MNIELKEALALVKDKTDPTQIIKCLNEEMELIKVLFVLLWEFPEDDLTDLDYQNLAPVARDCASLLDLMGFTDLGELV